MVPRDISCIKMEQPMSERIKQAVAKTERYIAGSLSNNKSAVIKKTKSFTANIKKLLGIKLQETEGSAKMKGKLEIKTLGYSDHDSEESIECGEQNDIALSSKTTSLFEMWCKRGSASFLVTEKISSIFWSH